MTARLLPPSATDQEAALEQATARIELVPVPVRKVWNPATIPADNLPWLAWAFCTPAWETNWSVAQKRQATQDSLFVLKHRGTPQALITGIAAAFPGATLQEWWQQTPPGDPYTFRLYLEVTDKPLDLAGMQSAINVVQGTKNLRSHLTGVYIATTSHPAETYACGAVCCGSDITIGDWATPPPGSAPLITDGSWLLDGSQTLDGTR